MLHVRQIRTIVLVLVELLAIIRLLFGGLLVLALCQRSKLARPRPCLAFTRLQLFLSTNCVAIELPNVLATSEDSDNVQL